MKHLQAYELIESSNKYVKTYTPEKYKKITGNDFRTILKIWTITS